MKVVKRDGITKEDVNFNKISTRIKKLCYGLDTLYVDHDEVSKKVIDGLYDGVTTIELDRLASETAGALVSHHPDYSLLASRIEITALHKSTEKFFSKTIEKLYSYINDKNGKHSPLISDELYEVVKKNTKVLNSAIINDRDFSYDYFGFKTLEKSYLLKIDGKVVERPQHMLMRVSLGIHGGDVESAIETYNLMSEKYFTHATPTLFNAGTPKPQMSSCFLLTMKNDSIEGIYDTLKQTALISQSAGGIGLAIHNIRATGSYIAGTNGVSNGLTPMLRVFNNTARYVDQGGGKRKGSFAIYIEPWHADILSFLDLKKNHGVEDMRARDLFYAMWTPDLFMKRVQEDGDWTLMCPNECPGLADVYGDDFEALYKSYEEAGKGKRTVKAKEVWLKILESQIETGTPYMLYKDAANKKSNQNNLGTIRSSNLCTEIIEYTSPDEVAVCNLASVALPKFVEVKDRKAKKLEYVFNHKKLHQVVKLITINLNKVIDRNYYPVIEAEYSNKKHRPIGLGVQGLADAFQIMGIPFTSKEAKVLNAAIFETMYHAAMESSMELAKVDGPYETFVGSMTSKGTFQFDLWDEPIFSGMYDWDKLKKEVVENGIRNSLLMAPMPTASTSQILGNNEAFEPYTTNIYTRRVLSGEFICVNKHLILTLINLGLWDDEMRDRLMISNGSIANFTDIPENVRDIYKTVWEISQRDVIDLSADRGAFICQSQSMNIFMDNPNFQKLTNMHFHGWKKGLKTGMYYLRNKPAVEAIKFTIDKTKYVKEDKEFSAENSEFDCDNCGS